MNYNNNNNNQQQVHCIARWDFLGDVNLSQLCFKQNTPLEVDFSIPPQNGWRWGICYGNQGWLPEWAAEPVTQQMPAQSPPGPIIMSQQQSSRSYKRNSLRRSRDYIIPLQSISERIDDEGQQQNQPQQNNDAGGYCCDDGFDQRNNDIMGGNVPRAKTVVDGSSNVNVVDDSSANNNQKNPFEKNVPDNANNGGNTSSSNKNKWGIKKLFQKQKVGTNNNNNNNNNTFNKNPYTQKAKKEPAAWDGCEVPQIVSGVDGQVAIIETDGHTSHYKNEKTYQIATTSNQIAEQVSATTKNVGHQIANFKMPRPIPKMNNNNSNNNKYNNTNTDNNSQQKQEQQPQQKQQQQQQVVVVTTNNDDEQKQPKKNKKFGIISMPSSLKMPKMPAMPKMSSGNNNKSKEEQQQQIISTPYCDVHGNQQTIVEERKRASQTSLNIYY